MAIAKKQVTVYELNCDACNKLFRDDELDYNPVYFDSNEPLETAIDCFDWKQHNGNHYCDECAQETPND